jgi:UDP-glucose 4-epimerase
VLADLTDVADLLREWSYSSVMKVLVTGGAGYIGAITAAALEASGHTPIVLDSLLSGPEVFASGRVFYRGDVADRDLLATIVSDHPDLACTIHMAARIVVAESAALPYEYYRNNVAKSLELFDQLERLGKAAVVFSSSASVYAATDSFEVSEDSPTNPRSPYARSKLMTEMVLEDLARAGRLRALILRYFNPIGSDPQLRFGRHLREPTDVLGQLVLAAQGRREAFQITGTDYPTRDGTGLRDYIHVWDLALAHVAAVEQLDVLLDRVGRTSAVINVGTGRGVTVRELIQAAETVLGRPVPVREAARREGDVAGAYAAVDRARDWLAWSARSTLVDGVGSTFAWAAKRQRVLGYP